MTLPQIADQALGFSQVAFQLRNAVFHLSDFRSSLTCSTHLTGEERLLALLLQLFDLLFQVDNLGGEGIAFGKQTF